MQSIGPILWFIIIGALFYLMMRGCCGGGGHSHGRGSDRGGSEPEHRHEETGHEHGKEQGGDTESGKKEHKHGSGCC